MSFKTVSVLAGILGLGLPLAGHAAAKDMTAKDLAACVWDATSDADRASLATDPTQPPAKSQSFAELAAAHPSANAAFDRCRNGAITPALWKGHFLATLGMEHWAVSQLKAKAVDEDRLAQAWATVPADQQVCLGVLTAWAIASVETSTNAYLSRAVAGCNSAPSNAGMQSFLQAAKLDGQSDAGKLAGLYAFSKGGETVVIGLMANRDTTPAGAN